MAGLVLAAGLVSAVLVRYSPGAPVDQRERGGPVSGADRIH